MKYKKEVKAQLEDLKEHINICVRNFEAVEAIKRAIERNARAFGLGGNAGVHLEKAKQVAILDIKEDVEWTLRMIKSIEGLINLEEEKEEVE